MTVTTVAERDADLVREASEWFALVDGNDLTAEDRQRFETWQRRSPDHEQAYRNVAAMWQAPAFHAALSSIEPVVCAPQSAAHCRPQRSRSKVLAGAAAAMVLLSTLWFLSDDLLTIMESDYRTAVGEQRTVRLPDHSSMTLNTNTAIVAELEGPTRRIRLLKGEALFHVSRDPDRPFTVEHKGTVVRVLGTEFVVRERQETLTVTVIRGTVEVTNARDSASVLQLTAGEQVSSGPQGLGARKTVDPADLTAWTSKRLAVMNAPLSDVIQEIQRYHPGYLWLWNSGIGRIRVTGIYDLSDTAVTLNVLAHTLPIRMDRLTDRLVVIR